MTRREQREEPDSTVLSYILPVCLAALPLLFVQVAIKTVVDRKGITVVSAVLRYEAWGVENQSLSLVVCARSCPSFITVSLGYTAYPPTDRTASAVLGQKCYEGWVQTDRKHQSLEIFPQRPRVRRLGRLKDLPVFDNRPQTSVAFSLSRQSVVRAVVRDPEQALRMNVSITLLAQNSPLDTWRGRVALTSSSWPTFIPPPISKSRNFSR